jgi:TldD protein
MPNVNLRPGPAGTSLEDLIAGVDDGLLIDTDGSYSIDQQRYNFQFAGQGTWEIKGGKRGRMLRDVAYQGNTVEFWNSCDGLGGPDTYEVYGSYYDGKGQPGQVNAVSHGCPPARFRQVNVLPAG